MWMNRMDVDEAVLATRQYPVASRAARLLQSFVEEVDKVSDGWPYWKLPSNAAKQLMQLLSYYKPFKNHSGDITETQLAKALVPIKSFYTRVGLKAGMKLLEGM